MCFATDFGKLERKRWTFCLFTQSRAQKEEDLQNQEDTSHAKKHQQNDE